MTPSSSQMYFVLLIVILGLSIGCDGSDRIHKTNEEVLIENKLLDSFSESVKYFPETYNEITTDTILDNGYRVKIKYFSESNKTVLNEYSVDSINYKHYYREFKADIYIEKENDIIFSGTFDKDYFISTETPTLDALDGKIMYNIWLEEFDEHQGNHYPIIFIQFCKPESDDCVTYKLIFHMKDHFMLEFI